MCLSHLSQLIDPSSQPAGPTSGQGPLTGLLVSTSSKSQTRKSLLGLSPWPPSDTHYIHHEYSQHYRITPLDDINLLRMNVSLILTPKLVNAFWFGKKREGLAYFQTSSVNNPLRFCTCHFWIIKRQGHTCHWRNL